MDTNDIRDKLSAAISDLETPRWAVPILLCIRDDHELLHEHLAAHQIWVQRARQIIAAVVTALAVALALWCASGRFPQIFGP